MGTSLAGSSIVHDAHCLLSRHTHELSTFSERKGDTSTGATHHMCSVMNWSDIIICIRDRCETVLVLDSQGPPNQRVQLQPDTGNEVCSWVYALTVTSITSFAVTAGVFLRSSPACTPVLLVWDIVRSCS